MLMLLALGTSVTLGTVTLAEDIAVGGDTANVTEGGSGSSLDIGNTDTGTNDTTNTVDDTTNLDLGNTDTTTDTTNDTATDTTTDTTTSEVPTYEKVANKENAYKFDVLIPDANKSYVVKFATGTKDLVLSNFIVNNNNISDNLKNSLSLVIKDGDKKTVVKLSDLDVQSIDIPKTAELYLIYNPNGVDNSNELSLSDNKLNIYAEQIRQPLQEGELQYNNGEIQVVNPVDYQEATVNYDVKPELVKDVKTKKALTKKDTGPVENTALLVLAILLIIVGVVRLNTVKE